MIAWLLNDIIVWLLDYLKYLKLMQYIRAGSAPRLSSTSWTRLLVSQIRIRVPYTIIVWMMAHGVEILSNPYAWFKTVHFKPFSDKYCGRYGCFSKFAIFIRENKSWFYLFLIRQRKERWGCESNKLLYKWWVTISHLPGLYGSSITFYSK